jgi:transcriptional regulator with XRE-family HTH domain
MTQSQIIKLLIKVAGTQSNLAKIAESSQGQISDYLNEKRSLKVGKLLKICQKLKLTLKIEKNGTTKD